jgi:hypothetical protein
MGEQLLVLQCVSRLGVASQANIFMTKSYNRKASEVVQHPYTKLHCQTESKLHEFVRYKWISVNFHSHRFWRGEDVFFQKLKIESGKNLSSKYTTFTRKATLCSCHLSTVLPDFWISRIRNNNSHPLHRVIPLSPMGPRELLSPPRRFYYCRSQSWKNEGGSYVSIGNDNKIPKILQKFFQGIDAERRSKTPRWHRCWRGWMS